MTLSGINGQAVFPQGVSAGRPAGIPQVLPSFGASSSPPPARSIGKRFRDQLKNGPASHTFRSVMGGDAPRRRSWVSQIRAPGDTASTSVPPTGRRTGSAAPVQAIRTGILLFMVHGAIRVAGRVQARLASRGPDRVGPWSIFDGRLSNFCQRPGRLGRNTGIRTQPVDAKLLLFLRGWRLPSNARPLFCRA